MEINLIHGDADKVLRELEGLSFDLIVFDPDHEMPNKLDHLDYCFSSSSSKSTLLFFGKNPSTIIKLLGDSYWDVRQLITVFKDNEQIGVVVVATDDCSTKLDFPNLQRIDVATKGADGHPTSKDATWIDAFLDTGRYKHVLDPYMGSAQWGVSCQQRGISYTGIEIFEEYFNMAQENLGVKAS